ncbi:MAG: hypothetical protein A2017_15785 [Lentisphaerae bacterium GWF2_44_16]|nr:MAG: hypothetical protein A2017_15785 [Lentisphaerae bacterium GWF2_44_16]
MPEKFIDIHCHKDSPSVDIISVRNLFPSEKTVAPGFYSAGLHPWYLNADTMPEDLEKIRSMVKDKRAVAVGECGLDRLTETPFTLQEDAFSAQIKIAEECGKPLIIHAVRTYSEIISAKKKMKSAIPWIIHGFNGNVQIAEQLVSNNFYLSFGPAIMDSSARLAKILSELPEELLFLETDEGHSSIQDLYRAAAKIRKTDIPRLRDVIMCNFKNCFRIDIR